MTDLTAAAQRLRDSVAALTEGERVQPWWATDEGGLNWWVKAGGLSVANAGQGDTARNAARHAALVASPPTVTLLADLLEAISEHDYADDTHHPEECFAAVADATRALASAILHTDPEERGDDNR